MSMLDPTTFPEDVKDLDDEQLEALRQIVVSDQERRENLMRIPGQIKELAEKYREGGGAERELTEALSDA